MDADGSDPWGEKILRLEERLLATPAESGTGLLFKMNLLTQAFMPPDQWRPLHFEDWQFGAWSCDTQALIAMEIEIRRLCGLRLPTHDQI